MMFGLEFASSAFLIGIAAAAIPFIIHLLYRRRAPQILFSTLRFLRLSVERTARRKRLHDWLLLLLRAVVLALLAIALANPFLPASSLKSHRPIATVILLDNSFSMDCRHDGARRFDRARDAVFSLIQGLPPGSPTALLLTNPPPGSPKPSLTTDRNAVLTDFRRARLSQARGQLVPAIQRAYDLLATSARLNKMIYIVTDQQANAWGPADPLALPEDLAQVPLLVIDVGRTDYRNLTLSDVQVRARHFVAQRDASVTAVVHNPMPYEQRAVLRLEANGRETIKAAMVPAKANATITFSAQRFDQPGFYRGKVSLPKDSLPADNERHFLVRVQKGMPVLLVPEKMSAVPFLRDTHFLQLALNPALRSERARQMPILPSVELAGRLESKNLSLFRMIFLVNVGKLSEAAAEALRRYVKGGGHVVIFGGPRVQPARYNQLFYAKEAPKSFLPGELLPARGDAEARFVFRKVDFIDRRHPLARAFEGARLLGAARVYRAFDVRPLPSARTILGLDGRDPLLLEKSYGLGKVLLFTSSATPDWTNLPLKKSFLPLMHELVYYLGAATGARADYVVGTPIHLLFSWAKSPVEVELRHPTGEVTRAKSDPKSAQNVVVIGATHRPGAYQWATVSRPKSEGGFAINIDPVESDLEPLAAADLRARFPGPTPVNIVTTAEEAEQLVQQLSRKREFWMPLFAAVLVLILAECLLSNWILPMWRAARQKGMQPAPAQG